MHKILSLATPLATMLLVVCKYQVDKISGLSKYNLKGVIPEVVEKEIEKIFIDLSRDELLSRYLESTNQNANKAFNQILWRKCPKNTFVSKDVLEMGTFLSVVSFNDGFLALANILKNRALVFDSKRVKNIQKKLTDTVKNNNNKKVKSYKERVY